MKKSRCAYIFALTGTDMRAFDDLIGKKFRKFLVFFDLMKDYSEEIKTLEYQGVGKDALSIIIHFTKEVPVDEKTELLLELKERGYEVKKWKLKDKKIKLQIRAAE